ncbi:hypothetical protein BV898_04583 [Hypsibius exemplaris]|uniref:EB domain-containing protein n=1 Tax=Hypsibius exemplaris TaxID=2072580 RepID=A0A1W0X1P6_HYPEX|nr:hypothetical protein BV898_04583 [Hypsibius exemplaris]
MYSQGLTALLVLTSACLVMGANRNEPCNNVNDCVDAGTTCSRGFCVCWADMGFNVAVTWACTEDASCRVLFPGHLCRASIQCGSLAGRTGYCQPEGAIRG